MVALDLIRASNASLATAYPDRLVGVFAGATSGIGEYTLKSFARYAAQPRAYFIGRNKEAGARIKAECEALNPKGEFVFIASDTSLLQNVDKVCAGIQAKEPIINLLILTQGTLMMGVETSEKLQLSIALAHYARARFIANLIPQLERANGLRRVVTVYTGGKEGVIDLTDIQRAKGGNLFKARGHGSSLVTLHMAHFADKHPSVSFVHTFPGAVRSNIGRQTSGALMGVAIGIFRLVGPLIYIPDEESGDRHLYLATSAKLPAKEHREKGVEGKGEMIRGLDGKEASGMYDVDEKCEPAGKGVEELIRKLRNDGTMEKVWKDVEEQFMRITGKA